jgi:hypothetical protein
VRLQLSPIRRVILSVYGLVLVLIFVWVPWRAYAVLRGRVYSATLGYGLIWSPPAGPDWVQYSNSYIVDYGRVGLEFGVFTGLLLVAWVTPAVSPPK